MQSTVFKFAEFELDQDAYALRREGRALSLERIPLDLLFLLVERRGRLVTRKEILDRVWGKSVFVDAQNAVNTAVRKLRRVLSDDPRSPRFVLTVPTKGYRFVGVVESLNDDGVKSAAPANFSTDGMAQNSQPMVGREKELVQLSEYFALANGGKRQIVFVTGEPGIGKTTVVESLLSALAYEKGTLIGRGQCVKQYGAGEPYMPVLEALTRLRNEACGDHLVEILRRVAPSWLTQMPALLSDAERERLHGLTQGVTQPRMLREIAEALEALTQETPLVLLFEDLHWSDLSTLELIAAIGRRTEPARLLIIGTYRPVEMLTNEHPLRAVKEELQLQRRCEEVKLRLLSEQDVASYLSKRFPDEESSQRSVAAAVHERTEGNPLFVVNVIDYLVEHGRLKSVGRIEAPPTIQQMIRRNLERLDPAEQETLEAASVTGVEFSAATIAAALERPLTEIETCCSRLARREQFISPTGTANWPDGSVSARFRLNHALYSGVLYDLVPPNRRAQLHQRIAESLEAAYRERANEIASELAHHYRRANVVNKAINYLAVAGEQAIQRSAHADAVGSLTAAIDLLKGLPDGVDRARQEVTLQVMLGTAFMASKGYASQEVKNAYTRAYSLCRDSNEVTQLPALFGLWVYYEVRGDLRIAVELAGQQCLRLAEAAQERSLLVQAHLALGATLYQLSDLTRARSHLAQSLQLYHSCDHRHLAFIYGQDPATVAGVHLALVLWHLGFPGQALEKANEAVRLAQELQHPLTTAFAAGFASWVHQVRGEVDATRKQAETAIALSAEHGLPLCLAMGRILRGWTSAELGDPEGGIKEIQDARQACEAAGALLMRPYFLTLLAEACRKGNRIKEGRAVLAEAFASIENNGERAYEPEILRLQAEFLLADGPNRDAEAEGQIRSAVRLARLQNAKSLELRATTTLARLLAKQHREDEGRAVLVEIYNWFKEGFDTENLKQARSVLEQLA